MWPMRVTMLRLECARDVFDSLFQYVLFLIPICLCFVCVYVYVCVAGYGQLFDSSRAYGRLSSDAHPPQRFARNHFEEINAKLTTIINTAGFEWVVVVVGRDGIKAPLEFCGVKYPRHRNEGRMVSGGHHCMAPATKMDWIPSQLGIPFG